MRDEGSTARACETHIPHLSTLMSWCIAAILLAGCTEFQKSPKNEDPYWDAGSKTKPAKGGTPAGSSSTPMSSLPPLPPNTPGSSPAALASVPKNNGDDLRIPALQQGPATRDPWAGVPQGGPPPSALLQAPQSGGAAAPVQPVAGNVPPQPVSAQTPNANLSQPSPPPIASAPATSSSEDKFRQAQRELTARGVIGQRLEMTADTGEWKFSCYVPNRQNPKVHRAYGARAKDPLAAIQAVLEKIDQEQL